MRPHRRAALGQQAHPLAGRPLIELAQDAFGAGEAAFSVAALNSSPAPGQLGIVGSAGGGSERADST